MTVYGSNASVAWDPGIYMRFGDMRTRPAVELAARIPLSAEDVRRVEDLGCGPGNSTSVLAARFSRAEITGLDLDPSMLERAAREGPQGATWRRVDLSEYRPEPGADVLFANATYQWIDRHEVLFPALLSSLRPGGALAIQMPANFDQPSHVLMRETAGEPDFAAVFENKEQRSTMMREDPVKSAADYYVMLADRAAHLDIWYTEYLQPLEGDDPVLAWVRGTGLRPYLASLEHDPDLQRRYVQRYREKLRKAYPQRDGGITLFAFKRLFFVATAP